MGNRHSRANTDNRCPNCGYCHGMNVDRKECPRCLWRDYDDVAVRDERPALEFLNVRPIVSTLRHPILGENNELDAARAIKEVATSATGSVLKRRDVVNTPGGDFMVSSLHPPNGRFVRGESQVQLLESVLDVPLQSITVRATTASVESNERYLRDKRQLDDDVRDFFTRAESHSNVARGDVFVFRWRRRVYEICVTYAFPRSGRVTRSTHIRVDHRGPLDDLERVDMRPLFSTLPNNEKDIRTGRMLIEPSDLIRKYLRGYFLGREIRVSQLDELDIQGVNFCVWAAGRVGVENEETGEGVITPSTLIFAESAVQENTWRRRVQEMEQNVLARRAQQMGLLVPALRLQQPLGDNEMPDAADLENALWMQQVTMRLQMVLATLPPNHPQRAQLARIVQLLASGQVDRRGFENALRNIHRPQVQAMINALPTYPVQRLPLLLSALVA
ncbi:MAG: hypothetical protein MHM6MM_005278 [Cercozoa sp. M6MM]